MKILCVASEAAPYVKTGGLADVMGALPAALRDLGHDVRVVLPFYKAMDAKRHTPRLILDRIEVWLPAGNRSVSVWQVANSHKDLPVYLIKNESLFGRPSLYDERGREYSDNPLRFSYFCLSVFWLMKALRWFPDVLHCHDWQAAMVPVYLRNLEVLRLDPDFSDCRTLLTIHNLAYQGVYSSDFLSALGLPWELFTPTTMEYWGKLNLLKGGLVFADALSTVSRRYAKEIQTTEFGCGLDGVLRQRSADLHGIMNGIDVSVWNPETDPHLPARYSVADLSGKAACKAELQRRFALAPEPQRPVAGVVSRMVEQKGFDLIAESMKNILDSGLQLVMLGSGMQKYESLFRVLGQNHPGQLGVRIGYDDELSHLIKSGSDIFFMPSRFEPCGLNQFYSMRFGTVPVVRETGGLADSVVNATDAKIASGEATGFTFKTYSAKEFFASLQRAMTMFRDRPDLWRKLMLNGMSQDWSWNRSAKAYEELFRQLIARKPARLEAEAVRA